MSEAMAEYISKEKALWIAESSHWSNVPKDLKKLPSADVIEQSKIYEAIDKIIGKSFCSDILNDKTDMELVKLDDVLEILTKTGCNFYKRLEDENSN